MSDQPKTGNPPASAKQAEAIVKDLPAEAITAADAETVKGGLGINRIVVTDGTIKAK